MFGYGEDVGLIVQTNTKELLIITVKVVIIVGRIELKNKEADEVGSKVSVKCLAVTMRVNMRKHLISAATKTTA